jgi:hypothetical protein
MGDMRNAYKILVGKHGTKRTPQRRMLLCDNNIKMDLEKYGL